MVHNHCPGCNHHKDLERPGMDQLEQDCKMLQMRQERPSLGTLTARTGEGAAGQDL